MSDNSIISEQSFSDSKRLLCKKYYHSGKGRQLPIVLGSLAVSFMLLSGCSDKQSAYEESVSEDSVSEEVADYASEESTEITSEQSAVADIDVDSRSRSSKLKVENQAGDSEQAIGSQVTDIQIEGKELLITANANFKVEDVVKSTSAIENLTRQQGGYVALSKTTNIESDSRTFNKGDQNVTLTTYYRQATMTVRIPREKVSGFLKQVQQQVAFLNEQEFSAQDVTLDIYRQQLASKLNSDMASELSQERLNSKNDKDQDSNVDTITATYAARQQQEYAQLEKLDIADRVKYSTIDFTFTQPNSSYKETTQNLDIIIDAERPSFAAQVGEAFKEGWNMLRAIALGLIQLWWLVVLFGVFYLIYRMIKSLYRKLFKNDAHLKNLKRDLVDKSHARQYSTDLKKSRVNDNQVSNADSVDNTGSTDDKNSN